MKCKARYIGPDRDLGYYHGSIYKVRVYMHKKHIFIEPKYMWVRGYSTMSGLVKDWDFNVEEDSTPCNAYWTGHVVKVREENILC